MSCVQEHPTTPQEKTTAGHHRQRRTVQHRPLRSCKGHLCLRSTPCMPYMPTLTSQTAPGDRQSGLAVRTGSPFFGSCLGMCRVFRPRKPGTDHKDLWSQHRPLGPRPHAKGIRNHSTVCYASFLPCRTGRRSWTHPPSPTSAGRSPETKTMSQPARRKTIAVFVN